MYIKILFNNARLAGVLKFILLLSIVHSASFYFNYRTPFGLLYGPLLLLIVMKIKTVRLWLHMIPFLVFSILYSAQKLGFNVFSEWDHYYWFYFISVAVSLAVYGTLVYRLNKVNYNSDEALTIEQEFVQLLVYGSFIAALLVGLLAFKIAFGITDLGFDPNAMLFFQLGIFIFLMVMYLVFSEKNKKQKEAKTALKLLPQIFDETTSSVYMETLEKCIRETDIYRNPDISLEMLASETTIPKHHLTQLLNRYLGKNFYQYIAELRIEYAQKCLKNDSGIKIESLAYECGFNSKTSFNRYFKEYTGYLPSYYKAKVQHS